MTEPDKSYWEKRWAEGATGWDIGYPSTPITRYIDTLETKNLRILVPGCGNAYEGGYLFENGFENTFLLDISELAIAKVKKNFPQIPASRMVQGDFFEHEESYDLIIEQTFFCALNPDLRASYAKKMHSLLKPGGKLIGLLFDDILFSDHPPFGGNKEEYIGYFEPYFEFLNFDTATNSIKPREGRELFIELLKK